MKKISSYTPGNITEGLQQLDELQNSMRSLLSIPTESKDIQFWPVCSKRQLTVFTNSQILATQMQYQKSKLLAQLNKLYSLNLNGINIRLIPTKIASETIKKQSNSLPVDQDKIRKPVSQKAVDDMIFEANNIEDDEMRQLLKDIANDRI
jgi:hypothetical protein